MKKLIFKKFYKDLSGFFLVILLLVGIIVWTIQAVNYFDFVTEDGHGLKIYFYYSILNFPKIIHGIFPFIFSISIFYMIIKYENKNEMFIFWINGINKLEFVNKLILISFIFMFFQIVLGSIISPKSKLNARNYLKDSNVDFFTSLIKEGKFINVTKNLTIFINSKEDDGTFKNIFLEEDNKKNSKMIYAKEAVLIDENSKKILQLSDGRVINIQKDEINIFDFDQINFNLSNLNSKSITTPKIQEIDTKILLSCFFNIENNKFLIFECSEKLIIEIKLELIKRLFKPIYIPLIVLFSSFLILFSNNQKNYRAKTYLIFIFVIFLLILSEVSAKYFIASSNFLIIYLLTPLIIFFISYYLFYMKLKNV